MNAEFDFHLEATGNMTEPLPFIIDNVGGIGRILKNSSLDYERRQSYIFRVSSLTKCLQVMQKSSFLI